jgi:threonine/homoserine/homoserine lactone efflux protein
VLPAFLAFTVAAGLLVVLPGPDTLVVVRNMLRGGRRQAASTACGVLAGLAVWVIAAVLGVAALLRASETGFVVLKVAGALYLVWLGAQSLRSRTAPTAGASAEPAQRRGLLGTGFGAGLATDLLNPKVGMLFIALLPGFVPHGANVPLVSCAFGAIFIVETAVYFAVLIRLTDRVSRWMTDGRVRRRLDRLAGLVFLGFAARLATDS